MTAQLVHIVDDDRQFSTSINLLLKSFGFLTETYSCGRKFLDEANLQRGCVLLDFCMPEMDGLDVLRVLEERGVNLPVIMISGHGSIPVAVEAMKLGAADFLEKPLLESSLIDAISLAYTQWAATESRRASRELASRRIKELSRRELQVLQGLLGGLSNKGIARRLGLSVRTIEMHRARMLATLEADSLAEAVRMAIYARLNPLSTD